jgi:glycosyltransferase involved in cell wall biosynthesis
MVYIDLRIFSMQKMGGISVVWSEYLRRLHAMSVDIDITLLLPKNDNKIAQTLDLTGYSVKHVRPRGAISKYLPFLLVGNKNDILHTSYYQWYPFYRGKIIVTLHDFMHEKYAPLKSRILHNILKYLSLNSADVILCISESTKNDFKEIFPKIYLETDVRVIENAASENFYPDGDNLTHNNEFLWLGVRSGYKNFQYSLKLLRYLNQKEKNYGLSVVGAELNKEEKALAEDYGVFDQIKVFSNVDMDDLRSIYSNSLALLYLSKYEGFGLPILEAQKCLCPVIALKNPASIEIGKDSILYLNDDKEESILDVIRAIKDQKSQEKILKNGLKNAMRYDWDASVKKLVGVYVEYQNNE